MGFQLMRLYERDHLGDPDSYYRFSLDCYQNLFLPNAFPTLSFHSSTQELSSMDSVQIADKDILIVVESDAPQTPLLVSLDSDSF